MDCTESVIRAVKLGKRQKYDYRDIDRAELKLVRVGHALWEQWKRDRGAKWGAVGESGPLWAAIQNVWSITGNCCQLNRSMQRHLICPLGPTARETS
jgi:hypothetical protein